MKDILERLRERLISVPKPGTEWRDAGPNEWTTATIGGVHKAGDEAGLQYQSSLAIGGLQSKPKLRPHIYAVEPLCAEAADEIERLRANAPLTIQEGECPELDAQIAALGLGSQASGGTES